MSKIHSPMPQPERVDLKHDPRLTGAECWWRIRLRPNADNHTMITTIDDMENPTFATWEIFDGEDAELAIENLLRVRLETKYTRCYLDILHAGPPTPSAEWFNLTHPGDYRHPYDNDPHVGWPDGLLYTAKG